MGRRAGPPSTRQHACALPCTKAAAPPARPRPPPARLEQVAGEVRLRQRQRRAAGANLQGLGGLQQGESADQGWGTAVARGAYGGSRSGSSDDIAGGRRRRAGGGGGTHHCSAGADGHAPPAAGDRHAALLLHPQLLRAAGAAGWGRRGAGGTWMRQGANPCASGSAMKAAAAPEPRRRAHLKDILCAQACIVLPALPAAAKQRLVAQGQRCGRRRGIASHFPRRIGWGWVALLRTLRPLLSPSR